MEKGIFSMEFYGFQKNYSIRGYQLSRLHKFTEQILIEYCEVNYFQICGKGLSVEINITEDK